MSVGKFLAGFVIGGLVGSVVGVLLAPQSGEETREQLARKSSELYGKAGDAIKEIQNKADGIVEDMQKKGDELVTKIQDLLSKSKNVDANS